METHLWSFFGKIRSGSLQGPEPPVATIWAPRMRHHRHHASQPSHTGVRGQLRAAGHQNPMPACSPQLGVMRLP